LKAFLERGGEIGCNESGWPATVHPPPLPPSPGLWMAGKLWRTGSPKKLGLLATRTDANLLYSLFLSFWKDIAGGNCPTINREYLGQFLDGSNGRSLCISLLFKAFRCVPVVRVHECAKRTGQF
jgi:hypothetical protein